MNTFFFLLYRGVTTDGFKVNTEKDCAPVICTEIKEKLEATSGGESPEHHSVLLQLLSDQLGTAVENIRDFELNLFDTQPPTLSGITST